MKGIGASRSEAHSRRVAEEAQGRAFVVKLVQHLGQAFLIRLRRVLQYLFDTGEGLGWSIG